MALFADLAQLADQLATEPSRLKKRAAIAQAIAAVHLLSSRSAAEGSAFPATTPNPVLPNEARLPHPSQPHREGWDHDYASLSHAPEDPGLFAQYLAGLPFAEADPRKLNAGGALLTKAVLSVTGATNTALTAAYRRHGDLGAATHDLLATNRNLSSFRKAGGPAVVVARPSSATQKSVILSEGVAAVEGPALVPPPTLTLTQIATAFAAMATARTTAIRSAVVQDLLHRATPLEAKYLVKLMLGDMRIGVKQSLIEEAIAVAASAPVAEVRHAVMLEADLAAATTRAFANTLPEARMKLFHPLGFMLASPVDTPEEAIARFTEKAPKPPPKKRTSKKTVILTLSEPKGKDLCISSSAESIPQTVILSEAEGPASPSATSPIAAYLEDKYDGMRAQVHCGDPTQPGRVAIYSRNREDITTSFPELTEAFAHVQPDIDGPLILDGEILGWNFASATEATDQTALAERALPFATLGQRIGRKKVSNEWRKQVPVIFMVFDLMYAHGALTLDLPLTARRNRLEAIVEKMIDRIVSPLVLNEHVHKQQSEMFLDAPTSNPDETPRPRLILSPSRLVESAEDIDRAYAEARARANEGVMLKAANSTYQPGRRGLAWVKLKRELGLLDVVITGAEYGHGRRAGLLSDYTFAVRDRSGELLNVGKAYSGVTDIEIAELTEFLKTHTLEDHGHFRTVEPLIILEVAFNNIMRSTRHASGFALRFPRILRIRTDKPLAEIDTLDRVEAIYLSQVDRPTEAEG